MQYQIFNLDCRDAMSLYLEDNSVDAIVTDPPYELSNDGKQSPNRVFFELAFPQNSKIEANCFGGDCLSDFIGEILVLSGIRSVPSPTTAVPVCTVALDDNFSFGDNDVVNTRECPVTVSQVAARSDIETDSCKHLGSFALKLADTTKIFQILDKLGTGFYSGAIGVGFGGVPSSFPSVQHSGTSVNNSNEYVGLADGTLSDLICTLIGTTSSPVFSLQLARTPSENFTTDGARVFAAILLFSGAQLIRTRPATSSLPAVLEFRRICIVNDATNRAISLDILFHPQSIASSGFMGKEWDGSKVSYDVAVWKEMLRVLKPGGHLLSFGGSRTYHRMASAVEDAGFEIRDQIMWLYFSGMPKSHNGPWGGTALKPAHEPLVLARKPLIGTVAENVLAHGTGGLNIEGCRVGTSTRTNASAPRAERTGFIKGFVAGTQSEIRAHGRWPANLIHDGSDEVVSCFPDSKGQQGDLVGHNKKRGNGIYGDMAPAHDALKRVESETSAARFFYAAKASKKDREEGNNHSTVKPTDLMAYLCRLITPPGGVVLDPFMGSGSTGKAAIKEGFRFIGAERNAGYYAIAEARLKAAA